jgi:hypothetical protein
MKRGERLVEGRGRGHVVVSQAVYVTEGGAAPTQPNLARGSDKQCEGVTSVQGEGSAHRPGWRQGA